MRVFGRSLRGLTACACLGLIACSGGDEAAAVAAAATQVAASPASPAAPPASSAPSPATAAAPAPTAAAALPPAPLPAGTSAGCNSSDVERESIARINALRAAGATCGSQRFGPAAPLTANARLNSAAAAHSRDQAARNVLSHTGANGSSVGQRVTAAGYAWSSVAENLAAGHRSAAEVVEAWLNSPGHCANLMSASLVDAGMACIVGPASNTYSTVWTLNLGRPR